ncbi:MAG TPA: hypothetical protein VFI19_10900, partial [Nocardioides sp.]|nr:hypothetical protein [Nocardioides sp.]
MLRHADRCATGTCAARRDGLAVHPAAAGRHRRRGANRAPDAAGGAATAAGRVRPRRVRHTPWLDTDGNGCNQRDDVLLRDVVPGTVRYAPQG